MSVSACILLHYKDRDEPNAPKIAKALKGQVDKIVFFIDNPDIKFEDPDVTIIRSSHSFPVIARNAIGCLLDTDYVFFQDSDLMVEGHTIDHMVRYAEQYPNAVLGFEGCNMADGVNPYTDGETIERGDELREADMLIRTWLIPKRVVGLSINVYMNNRGIIPFKYTDDILFCLGNRYGLKEKNYVIPHIRGKGVVELDDGGEGQFLTPGHFQTRNQVCRFMMESRE